MGKGTAAMGQRGRGVLHIPCRRCGKRSRHKKTGVCASCGFGKTSKLRKWNWNKKLTVN